MPKPVLHIYLPAQLREDAEAGRVNVFNRITSAVKSSGWNVAYHGDSPGERAKAGRRGGYALYHMQEPQGADTLNLRRAYHYPFWQLEASNERWNFDVAKIAFPARAVKPVQARPFMRRWREKLLGDVDLTAQGYVFMPLQGLLQSHRSFQSMNPIAMIEATLAAEPALPIRATLHPKEVYTADERAALAAIEARTPRFRLVGGDAIALLAGCNYVVTQNSAVALTGFFAEKPAVLFAEIDFHHIGGSVMRDGVAAAFEQVRGPAPDFARYLFWFFRMNCINAGAEDAEDQIRARMRARGWPV